MLTTSPSPQLLSTDQKFFYDRRSKPTRISSPIINNHSTHVYPTTSKDPRKSSQCPTKENPSNTIVSTPVIQNRPNMVDAGTQYSPPPDYNSPNTSVKNSTSNIARLQLAESNQTQSYFHPSATSTDTGHKSNAVMPAVPLGAAKSAADVVKEEDKSHGKRQNQTDIPQESKDGNKKLKGDLPSNRMMPTQYEFADTRDLVVLISSMLMELIRYNDAIPLKDGHLTRFHSRAPPGISVIDYLQRLTTHATLSPPILLSMVYYIDRLCSLYPAFTISSLTVHRFLITSATVASKGLSDSFWTNKTYARVGGVSVKELALLELEFLVRVQWRIVPKPEVLVDYYQSLVERSPGYELEKNTESES